MEGKRSYRVLVTETRQKTVAVEARSEREARRRAEDAWKNAECLLGDEDFQGAEFFVLGEWNGGGKGKPRWIEPKPTEPKPASERTGGENGNA